jgi:Uma2 family endonuclease
MGTISALTADDLLALPDPAEGGHYELSEGELIEVPGANWEHEDIKAAISESLTLWNARVQLGRVYGDAMFQLEEQTARRPDVAFVSNERRSVVQDKKKIIPFIPELAVEVISPSEYASDSERKVHEYLAAGVLEVWQIYPESKTMLIRTQAGVRELSGAQIVESATLPGFSARLSDFFA